MRYKEFNRNKVLETCINLFWNNGFNSCSINEIVKKTGVNRFSLYEEFTDKEGILRATIELYKERYINKRLEIFKQKKPFRELLTDFFSMFFSDNTLHPPGCYIIHISTELADTDPYIKNLLDEYLSDLEAEFHFVIQADPESGKHGFLLSKHFTGLFCTSMCYCLIQAKDEQLAQLNNGMDIILNKNYEYATNIKQQLS